MSVGDKRAQHWVASAFWDEGDTASALHYFGAAALQGHAGSHNALGIIAEVSFCGEK